MRVRTISFLSLLAFYLSSCTVIGTLYPVSEDEKSHIFKKEFIGTWIHKGDSSSSYILDTLPGYNGKLYSINIIEETDNVPDTTLFSGYVINLEGSFFLDYSYRLKGDMTDFFVARHFIIRLALVEPRKIELSYPDPDKLLKLIDEQKIQLKYAKLKKKSIHDEYDYLILDKPAVLQKALKETMKYPKIYSEKIILNRLN
jgi:hypothetical protein